jgi:hypothetical protein
MTAAPTSVSRIRGIRATTKGGSLPPPWNPLLASLCSRESRPRVTESN